MCAPSSAAAVSALTLFFLASQPTANGFSTAARSPSSRQQSAANVRRRFRQAEDVEAVAVASNHVDDGGAAVTFLQFPMAPAYAAVPPPAPPSHLVRERMPTWLRHPRPHLAERNLSALRESMIASSYLSESEASTVLSAVEEASGGDPARASGAAEFLQMLVSVMEMDPNALIAGAFHYCTCVTARERYAASLEDPSRFSLSDFWDRHEAEAEAWDRAGVGSFGAQAAAVARDAARLKRTEAVAASVVAGGGGGVGAGVGGGASAPDDADGSVNLRGLLLSETRDWRALAIRSAACLYRLRGLLRAREEGEAAYGCSGRMTAEEVRTAREALHIFAPLASRLGMHRLKNELEGAAFRIKYRRQYRRVMSISLEPASLLGGGGAGADTTLRDGLQNVLDDVTARVTDVLRQDPTFLKYADRVSVSARVKEPFSLWRKMLKTGARHILDVPDAIALRVVLRAGKATEGEEDEVTRARERAMCYYVQKMCVDRFEPLPGRFKDYIERPKRNGYQSLHYTALSDWGGRRWPFEVQVRSEEMHRVAEFGFASHWNYKDFARRQSDDDDGARCRSGYRQDVSLEAYLRSVQEWHWNRQQAQQQQQQQQVVRPTSAAEEVGAALPHLHHYQQQEHPQQHLHTLADDDDGRDREAQLRARAERIAPYIEALSAAQSDLARDSVFVFLQDSSEGGSGRVLALPSGACVLDALREGERRFGVSVDWRDRSRGRGRGHSVEYNGEVSNVTERLHNGDVVMVRSIRRQQQQQPVSL